MQYRRRHPAFAARRRREGGFRLYGVPAAQNGEMGHRRPKWSLRSNLGQHGAIQRASARSALKSGSKVGCAFNRVERSRPRWSSTGNIYFDGRFCGKSNKSFTGTRRRVAICSRVSNDGELIPRSMRLRKSTETPSTSAKCSCERSRALRMERSRVPKDFLREGIVALPSNMT